LNDKISPDYPGRVCVKVDELTNHETEVVFFTGAAGDINPITTCGTDFEHLEKDSKARTTVYTQYGTFEHTKKIGYYLGEQVVELARSIPSSSYYDRFSFQAYTRTFWVPMQDKQPYVYNRMNWFTNRLLFGFKKWFMFPVAIASAGEEPNFPGLSIKHYPISLRRKWTINAYTMLHYIEMTIFKGTTEKKISIIGIPGELFEDYQRKFLERCPVGAKDTFLFQVANDWVGYLFPIKEYITQPGYEPIASTSPLAGSYIARELYRLWKEIKLEMLCFS
jgi:hypothetical protein